MPKHPGSSHNPGGRSKGGKRKGGKSRRVGQVRADVAGNFGTSHNSAPFKTGPISKGPMKTIKSRPQNRPGGNLGNAGQKGTT